MQLMNYQRQGGFVRCVWLVAGLFLALWPGQSGAEQRQQPSPIPDSTISRKQQREWLQWNHRRVQRDASRLVELAQELSKQTGKLPSSGLTPSERKNIDSVRGKAVDLKDKIEKADPYVLSLDLVALAEAIEAEAKNLRTSLSQERKDTRQLTRLHHLLQQVQDRAKRIAGRLRQP